MQHAILIIDDEEAVRSSIELLLTIHGYRVHTAADGERGVEALARHSPDVVLTDIVMPGSEGIEAIMRIKQQAPAVKVIAMSGGARINGQDFLAVARRVGADECLEKPFEADELMAALARCLGMEPAA